MSINKSNYDSMNWVDALAKSKQPIKDQESHLISQIGKGENIDNALEKAAQAAFSIPSKEISNAEAISMAAKDIQDKNLEQSRRDAVNDVKRKLATHDVDPVALGVVSKEIWDGCSDFSEAEKIAKSAVEKQLKAHKENWQKEAMSAPKPSMSFDPSTSKAGKISSTAAPMEDSAPVIHRQSPFNAPSIFDPFKLDRFAAEENAHDESIKTSKAASKAKQEASKDWRTESNTVPDDYQPLHGGAIQRSGGHDSSVFSSRVPRNQVSIMDDVSASSPEEAKAKMAKLFESKIEDNGQKIKDANKQRSESIQRKVEKDVSLGANGKELKPWDKVSKPLSTKELQARLMDLWMPPEPGK